MLLSCFFPVALQWWITLASGVAMSSALMAAGVHLPSLCWLSTHCWAWCWVSMISVEVRLCDSSVSPHLVPLSSATVTSCGLVFPAPSGSKHLWCTNGCPCASHKAISKSSSVCCKAAVQQLSVGCCSVPLLDPFTACCPFLMVLKLESSFKHYSELD